MTLRKIVLAAGAVAGSLSITPNLVHADPPASTADVDANLAKLRALQVFEVGDLLIETPAGRHNCYGPCPGEAEADAAAARRAAQRLQAFTDLAQRAAEHPSKDTCSKAAIDANLEAVRALKIVTVGALVRTPQTEACERAGRLASIAHAVKGR